MGLQKKNIITVDPEKSFKVNNNKRGSWECRKPRMKCKDVRQLQQMYLQIRYRETDMQKIIQISTSLASR